MKFSRPTTLSALALLLILAIGCSKIDGSLSGNQAPSVSFVNNQQDADSARTLYEIPNYTFIFPDSLQGFQETEGAQLPGELDTEAKFELIRYQYFFVREIRSIKEVNPLNPDDWRWVPASCYRIDSNIARYIWIQHTTEFQWKLGYNYVIDGSFEYYPVYSFAPLIFWRGSDPDGFVAAYRYLDYPFETDAALAAFITLVNSNDASLEDTTAAIHWVTTTNTQAVVNLTTGLGRIQKHVVFLQAIDNDGEVSEPAMRVFNRSNRAPNTPTLAYYKDGYTLVSQPGEHERHVINWTDIETDPVTIQYLQEDVSPYYEIPIATEQLENWKGLRFLVSGDDPDDQALVTIPLQFRFLLHRIPDALVPGYMNAGSSATDNGLELVTADSTRVALTEDNTGSFELHAFDEDGWSLHNEVELFNLPTGFYQLTVFSRDDGYESCMEPAWLRFKVQELTLAKDVLVLDFTPPDDANPLATLGFASNEEYMAYYQDLIAGALPEVKAATQGVANYQVVWHHEVGDGQDFNCRYWKMGMDPDFPVQLPFAVISQYKTIICLDDKWATSEGQGNPGERGSWISKTAKGFLMDYLDMGGSLFWTGWSSLFGTFSYARIDASTTTEAAIDDQAGDFLSNYMGILSVYGDDNNTFSTDGRLDGCLSGLPEGDGLPPLRADKEQIDLIRANSGGPTGYNAFYIPGPAYRPYLPDSALAYVEAYALNEGLGTVAAYTYESFTAGLPERQEFNIFRVARRSDLPAIFYQDNEGTGERARYPAYSTDPDATGCWLYIPNVARYYWSMSITAALDAWNMSRPDHMWANPIITTTGVVNSREMVFIRVDHQRIDNPADYWVRGDTVNVDLTWQPTLIKHRKPVILYTENTTYSGGTGFGTGTGYTNFRTAFNSLPLHMLEQGEYPSYALGAPTTGSGARSVVSGVLFQFYLPKLQDLE